ncbi:exoribonuclease family protein [Aulographum hederae CBS 113979]|uniref:Ribosomal RNA-processing protein 43 n=1 Tax=Aulographum hederae CBS 113979 TaxID=1176131 RepID=A0A6G1HEG8_9PEZI|nr:exoribonuclease family protein [Aulographum hederae CBS 113979]
MAATTVTQSLTFPPELFATLSPSPFLLAHLSSSSSTRPNGRTSSTFRKPTVNTNSLSHCNGSAVVRLGNTACVCGIRAEILPSSDVANPSYIPTSLTPESPDTNMADDDADNEDEDIDDGPEMASLNLLVPNIELSTGSSPAHLPGNPPSTLAQSLSQRLLDLLHSTRLIRAKDLRILYQPPLLEDDEEPDAEPTVEVKAYWVLYIDILFISLDGNAFDAAWGSVLAALKNTKLPKAWWDQDLGSILCSDAVAEANELTLRGLPVAATFAVFDTRRGKGMKGKTGSWVLADPDTFEEAQCEESVTVVVDDGGRIRRIEKSGGGVVGKAHLRDLVELSQRRREEWKQVLNI